MAANNSSSSMEELHCKVGFIGGGKMAQAIAHGIVAAKIIQPSNILASARTEETLSKWKVSIFSNDYLYSLYFHLHPNTKYKRIITYYFLQIGLLKVEVK